MQSKISNFLNKIRKLNPLYFLSFFIPLVFYLHNLSKSVYGGDVGDLVTAAAVGGVAHPPGYPLFTFLGFLLTRISFITPAFMVGLISVFSSALAVLVFFTLSFKLTKNYFISFVCALVLAFSYLFWLYAEIAEVFALNNFFVVILFFIGFLYYKEKKPVFLFLLAFFTGLSLTHHQTIALIFPSLFLFVISQFKSLRKNPKLIIKSLFFLLLGFLPYIYVPIAASHNPPVNWDNVKDINSFIHLVLRKDYGTFNAGTFNPPTLIQRLFILKTYFSYLLLQLTIPVVFLVFLGGLKAFLKDKVLFFAVIIGYLLSGPFFIGYAGFPLVSNFYIGIYERFFSMSLVILLIFLPLGILFFVEIINKLFKKKTFQNLFIGVLLIIPFSLLYYNFPKTDLSNLWVGDDLAYDLLSPAPRNSVVLINGDTALFNVWYLRYARNYRTDLQVINISGVSKDVYINKQTDIYLKENKGKKIEKKNLFVNVIKFIAKKRPVISYEILQPSGETKILWVPYGLGYKLYKSEDLLPTKDQYIEQNNKVWESFRYLKEVKGGLAIGSLTLSDIPSIYSNSLLAAGTYALDKYKDKDLSLYYFNKALGLTPQYYKSYDILGAYYSSLKECTKAEDYLLKGIALRPFEQLPYFVLYSNYKACLKDEVKAKQLIDRYNKFFQSDLLKDLTSQLKNKK